MARRFVPDVYNLVPYLLFVLPILMFTSCKACYDVATNQPKAEPKVVLRTPVKAKPASRFCVGE